MEIIFSCILPKLPAKSLLRFKSVSKSFLTEISSPKFNASFSDEANHGLLILPGKNQTFLIYELDSLCSPPTVFPYPIPSTWHDNLATIAGCSESYLLIRCGYSRDSSLILVNPTTHIFRIIPNVYVGGGRVEYGMCHCLDEFNNDDFKIVRFRQYNDPNTDNTIREVSVYSLRSNSWTLRKRIATTELTRDLVLVQNHLFVMICYSNGRMTKIGCFDMKAEQWSDNVLLSDTLLGEIGPNPTRYHDNYRLCLLDGCLCLTCYDVNKWTNSIWVMKEYGVKESWFKLTSIPVQGLQRVVYHPIAYRKGSSHELLCLPTYRGKYLWYNLRERQFTETGLESAGLSFSYIRKETLLNFPGSQPIHSMSEEHEKLEKEEEEDDDED